MPRPRRASSRPPDLQSLPMSDSLRELAARGELRLYAKGRLLIHEGEAGGTLFIILSGRLRTYSVNHDDSRRITYGEYLPGEFLGEMSLDGGTRSASVEAMEPSWCAVVTRHTVEQHIAAHPRFAFELLAKVIRRARMATLSLRAVALNDVYGRVVWLLNDRALPTADGRRVVGPITHQDMADLLGCTRPMVSRVMKELELGGWIDSAGHRISLNKPLPPRF
jgi:CRP/FNR family cyclic AMP-dependent transcriptional regulator